MNNATPTHVPLVQVSRAPLDGVRTSSKELWSR
jgi:hypothetical protein